MKLNFLKTTPDIESGLPTGMFNLSWKHRIRAFGTLFTTGVAFTLLSCVFMYLLNFLLFGLFFTLGNLCLLFSTFFLIGPKKQLKTMFDKKRIITSIAYLACTAVTLVVAFSPIRGEGLIVLLLVLLQLFSLFWYSLSYIPYARTTVRKIFTNCFRR